MVKSQESQDKRVNLTQNPMSGFNLTLPVIPVIPVIYSNKKTFITRNERRQPIYGD